MTFSPYFELPKAERVEKLQYVRQHCWNLVIFVYMDNIYMYKGRYWSFHVLAFLFTWFCRTVLCLQGQQDVSTLVSHLSALLFVFVSSLWTDMSQFDL